jgi:hypothetical protein
MTGEEHFRKAEELAQEAQKLLGHGDGQATAAAWAAVAQVHADLALAAGLLPSLCPSAPKPLTVT